MSLISEKLRGVMSIEPSAGAIEFDGRWFTWGDLEKSIGRIESLLDSIDLPRDGRVAVLLRNRPGQLAAAIAVLATNRCLVTLNPLLPDDRLFGDIADLGMPVVIGETAELERPGMTQALDRSGAAFISVDPLLDGAQFAPGRVKPRDGIGRLSTGVAIEMLTSGTTGSPKRVPLTRSAFDASFAGVASYQKGRDAKDSPRLSSGVQIIVNPITHIGGLFVIVSGLMSGRRICLLERFTVDGWSDAIARHRPKVVSGVPAALKMVLDADVPKERLASLTAITSGTAPLDPKVIDAFLERYGIPILPNYGATEFAGAVAGWTLADFAKCWPQKRGSTGRIHSNMQARIVDAETGEPKAPGEVGILELKGVQLGDRTDWLRTTDLAVLDADNFLFIRGRADNAIIRGGFKVHAEEVVHILEQHPAVREAVVLGLTDDRLGQVPAAAIILREGFGEFTAAELTSFAKSRLLPYQVPARFLFVKEVPRIASLKPALVQIAALFE